MDDARPWWTSVGRRGRWDYEGRSEREGENERKRRGRKAIRKIRGREGRFYELGFGIVRKKYWYCKQEWEINVSGQIGFLFLCK